MALNLGKLILTLLSVGMSLSAVQAQPSAQDIKPNVSLTLNSTTLLYSGQTVTVKFHKSVHHVHHVRISHNMRERCHSICIRQHPLWPQVVEILTFILYARLLPLVCLCRLLYLTATSQHMFC